jgi:Transposase IS66 family
MSLFFSAVLRQRGRSRRAQQSERMPRIGCSQISPRTIRKRVPRRSIRAGAAAIELDRRTQRAIEYRYAAADPARFRSFAVELAGLGPNVVLAYTSPDGAAGGHQLGVLRAQILAVRADPRISKQRHFLTPPKQPLSRLTYTGFSTCEQAHVFAAERIHADDTTVPVLAKGQDTRTGRLWAYLRDDRPFGGLDPPAAARALRRPDAGGCLRRVQPGSTGRASPV